jgi:phosphopantetheinyl transferase (holo-ACP synthase)
MLTRSRYSHALVTAASIVTSIDGPAPGWDGTGLVVTVRRPGYRLVRAPCAGSALARAAEGYLDDHERAACAALAARTRPARVLGRIAAKEAVRDWQAATGRPRLPPRWFRIGNDGAGRPRAEVPGGAGPRVSLAHHGTTAVAAAGGGPVGIDVEVVVPRGTVFARLALTGAELALGSGHDPDEWVTRLWTVKEAVAKAAGTGLRGRPKDFVVQEVDGEWAFADGRWVRSAREGNLVVSTVAAR